MKNLFFSLFSFILLLSFELPAKEYTPQLYPFPIPSSELATISSAIPYQRKYDFQKLKINLFPERNNVYLLEGRNELNIYYLKNSDIAPLMFVVSGVGGTGGGPVAETLMEQAYEAGYNVVSLPNPISWLFVLGVSRSGISGELSEDIADLYKLMKIIVAALSEKGLQRHSYALLGYSQGAAILPALDVYDSQQSEAFGFSKIIMLNPPYDFKRGIHKLDAYYEQANNWSKEYKDGTMGYLYSFAEKLMRVNSNPIQLLGQFSLTKKQQEFIIGQNYRETLGDILFTQEVLLGRKYLTSPLSWGERSARYSEARSFTFEHYIQSVLLPYLQTERDTFQDIDSIYGQYDFKNFSQHMIQGEKYFLFHNQDDFLLTSSDLQNFFQIFPESRRFIYPFGGHCGNFNFPINRIDLRSVLEIK